MIKFLSAVYVINDSVSIKVPSDVEFYLNDGKRILKLNYEWQVEIFKVEVDAAWAVTLVPIV